MSEIRNEGNEHGRTHANDLLTGPSRAPTFVVTQHDECTVSGSHSQDEAPPKTKALLAPTGVPSTLKALSRRRSLSPSPTLDTPAVDPALTEASEILAKGPSKTHEIHCDEGPFPKPTRTNSFWKPVEHPPATKGRRSTQRAQSAAQIAPWMLPTAICYVPYGESQRNNKTTVDLVIVYMYRKKKNLNAHERFFECPEPGPELNAHRGRAGALLATSGQDMELQSMQPGPPPEPTKPSANGATQAESEKALNWLSDSSMLPEVMPHNRTICVGYDLDTVADPKLISYERAAIELIEKLDARRETCSNRPIIFIGHGLGCLVVQQAFKKRAANAVAESIQTACTGILFHHVPEDNISNGPTSFPRMERRGSNIPFATSASSKPSTTPEQNHFTSNLTKTAREHSILHHVLKHGPSGNDHAQSFKFSTKNDFTFQELSAKILEWSETHQIMRAVTQHNVAAVVKLIDEGVKINLRKTFSQMTALHVACQMPSSKSQDIDLLVRVGKADVTLKDHFGRTPLHFALRREQCDIEIVRVLLEAGAEITTPDCDGVTPWDQAKNPKVPRKVRRLLRMRPLVKGPSAAKGAVTRAQPLSQAAADVCDAYQMAATEMYFDSQTLTEKHLPRHFSISDAIYGKNSLQSMLDDTRSSDIKDELVCRWYHLPANNMAWVEDLFRNRFDMHPTIWSEQVRDSEWPHGRCIVPHTAQFVAESGESVLAICMPYVSYEDNYHQHSVSNTVRNQVPSTQAKWHEISGGENLQSPSYSGSSDTRGVSPDVLQQQDVTSPSSAKERRPRSASAPLTDGSGSDRPDSSQSRRRGVSPYDSDDDSDFGAFDGDASKAAASRLSKEEENLVRVYLYHSPPLHMRRTLDQYYYYMLEDTRKRDADQVVTRWARDRLDKPHHNILMVDQLWIWVIKGSGGQTDRVVSCFPEREGHGSGFLDDLQRNVLHYNTDKRQPIKSAAELVARIVTTCSDIFGWSQEAELVRFLHFFEATVGQVGDDEIKLLNSFAKSSESLQKLNGNHVEYAKKKDSVLDEMLDVRDQVKLLEEAKDIRDEINIILHVLGEQRRVLQEEIITCFFGPNANDTPGVNGTSTWREPLRLIKRAIGDFEKMDKQTKDIVDDLNHLLDLQQKQATVWEARSTREGTLATSKQGSVMVIFTMVTIIFLPLSFCASFFALDIAEFPADEKGQTNWPIQRLCAYLFGISFAVIIPFIAVAFATESATAAYYHLDKYWLIPAYIRFLDALARLPWMKPPCSAALERVDRRREKFYGEPTRNLEDSGSHRASRPGSSTAEMLSLDFGNHRDDAWSSNESNCSGSDAERQGHRGSRLSRWMRERRERKGRFVDEDV